MALWFDIEEFQSRQSKLKAVMEANGLDGMLLFKQESMYYLTGYDTSGYSARYFEHDCRGLC